MQIKSFLWYLFWYILYPLREKNSACVEENFSSWTEDMLFCNKKIIWYSKHEKTKLHKINFLDKYCSCQPKFNRKEFLLRSEGCCGAVESSPRVPAHDFATIRSVWQSTCHVQYRRAVCWPIRLNLSEPSN